MCTKCELYYQEHKIEEESSRLKEPEEENKVKYGAKKKKKKKEANTSIAWNHCSFHLMNIDQNLLFKIIRDSQHIRDRIFD